MILMADMQVVVSVRMSRHQMVLKATRIQMMAVPLVLTMRLGA
jgi:hypothetical protein